MREIGGPTLERLALAAEKLALGERPGLVPVALTGPGETLAGHRAYAPGDDPRRIDHRAWARLDRPIVRTYRRDREQRLHLIVDASASMAANWPERFERVQEIAAALAAVGLAGLADVRLSVLHDDARTVVAQARGRASSVALLSSIRALRCRGRAPLRALQSLLHGAPRGVCVLLTDFLDDAPPEAWAKALAGPVPTWVIACVHPADPLPQTDQHVELVDSESGARRPVVLDADTLAAARARLRRHRALRAATLRARGMRVIHVDVTQPWESAMLGPLRAAGLVIAA